MVTSDYPGSGQVRLAATVPLQAGSVPAAGAKAAENR